MSHYLGKAVVPLAAAGMAAGGVLYSTLTTDAMLPLAALAVGVAVAIVRIWQAPRDAQLERATRQLDAMERRLVDCMDKLAVARAALAEAGIRINVLEHEHDHDAAWARTGDPAAVPGLPPTGGADEPSQ